MKIVGIQPRELTWKIFWDIRLAIGISGPICPAEIASRANSSSMKMDTTNEREVTTTITTGIEINIEERIM
jgi:hypothetical protein